MLDVSTKRCVKDAEHWFRDIDQLYHPTGVFAQDSINIVYSFLNVNKTKFFPILLKEWFYLVEENGYLIIDYRPNKICDWKNLERTLWWLWKGKYDIVFHGIIPLESTKNQDEKSLQSFIDEKESYYKRNLNEKSLLPSPLKFNTEPVGDEYVRFLCKKKTPTKLENDSIDLWTFGIITNGKRLDWIEEILESIRAQKIPNYEIIICGSYFDRKELDVKYISFNQRDSLGWISKKKNLIVKASRYENICMIHDRIVFNRDWYEGMLKWGNCFDHLGCPQFFEGKRAVDWLLHEKLQGSDMGYVSALDYRDWDVDVVQAGQLHIVKKTFVKNVPWNESYHWGEPEDQELSARLTEAGHILRLNVYATFKMLFHRFGKAVDFPVVPYNRYCLPKKRIGSFLRLIGRKMYKYLYKYPIAKAVLLKIGRIIQKY